MSDQNAEVMRQFLVSLGFKVNEVQKRTFDDSVLKIDGTVKRLGTAVLATAASAQVLLVSFANSFERLYYLSQRTGTSAADIKAAGQAGRQIGLNAEAIEAAISNISRSIKADPGTAALIEGLTGKSVQGRGIDKVLQDVVRSLSKYPDFFAFQMAGQIGIDPDTYLQLKNNLNEYVAAQERQKDMFGEMGVDVDKTAKSLKEYNQELAKLSAQLEMVGLKFADKMLPVFKELAGVVGFLLDGMSRMMDEDPSDKRGALEKGLDIMLAPVDLGLSLGGRVRDWLFGPSSTPEQRKVSGKVTSERAQQAPKTAAGAPTRGVRNNNPGNIEYGPFARRHGAVGTDGRFAVFPDMQTGTQALAALMASYKRGGYDTIDEIVERYAPSHENNTSAYKNFLSKRMGVGVGEKLGPQHMAGLISGIGLYESRFDPLASGGVTIQQNNNIKVQGVSDPKAAAKHVEDSMYQINADITRNLKGAVR